MPRVAPRDTVVAYCRPENVDGAFADALACIILHDGKHARHIDSTIGVEGGPRIARSRTEVVRAFLKEGDWPWLLWLDADMTPPEDIVERLIAEADPVARPIVGALCFAGGRTTIKPTIYTFHRVTDDDGNTTAIRSDIHLGYPTPSLIEVDGTGSAAILIHRSVFEKLRDTVPGPLPWYQELVIGGEDWGEDLVFCLRARQAGFPIFIHTGVKVGHRKKHVIDEDAYKRFLAEMEATHQDLPAVMDADTFRTLGSTR